MNTATHIRDLTSWNGRAALYRMNPPYEGHEHVIVSAVNVPLSGPETYIFPADLNGIISWSELSGSQRGTLSRAAVLRDIGYNVKEA